MSDDKQKVGPQDGKRVNVHERYEVAYWTEKWGVRADELKSAVQRVGVEVEAVRRALGK